MGFIYLVGLPVLGFFIALGMRMYAVDRRLARATSKNAPIRTADFLRPEENVVSTDPNDTANERGGTDPPSRKIRVKVGDKVLFGRGSENFVDLGTSFLSETEEVRAKEEEPPELIFDVGNEVVVALPAGIYNPRALNLVTRLQAALSQQGSKEFSEIQRDQLAAILKKMEKDGASIEPNELTALLRSIVESTKLPLSGRY